MKIKVIFGMMSVALGATALSPAFAADIVPFIPAPIVVTPPPPPTWTGGYVGGHVGILRGYGLDGTFCEARGLVPQDAQERVEVQAGDQVPVFFLLEGPFEDIDGEGSPCDWYAAAGTLSGDGVLDGFGDGFAPFYTETTDFLTDLNGHLAGVQIGFRKQLGNGANGIVIGAEVAHSILSVQDTIAGIIRADSEELAGVFEWHGIFELNSLTTATLNIGFGTPRFLIYGEVGLAIGTASYTNNFGFAETDTAHGLVFGGGAEFRIADHVSIFGEYNRVRLNEVQMLGVNATIFPMLLDVDVRANVYKAGFNIQFGGD